LSGDQGFQAPVAYSVIKESQNPPQFSRAFVFSQAFSENREMTLPQLVD
jgi:hypothetical protein